MKWCGQVTPAPKFCLGISPEANKAAVQAILVEGGIGSGEATQEERAAFALRGFHPEVVTHARRLFIQRNYFHAVFEAAKAYNKAVKLKAQSEKDGQDLLLTVWGCEKGVLKITTCSTDTDRSVQDGVKFLSAGLMSAIRNPTAHEPALHWPISRDDCQDILSFISFWFRKLDAAIRHPS